MSIDISQQFNAIIVNPKRFTDCELCMSICSFIHDKKYIPLSKRILGTRKRIELEWAISCDLCKVALEDFLDSSNENNPKCILSCPNNAIFLGTIERVGNESRIATIKRVFNQKLTKNLENERDSS